MLKSSTAIASHPTLKGDSVVQIRKKTNSFLSFLSHLCNKIKNIVRVDVAPISVNRTSMIHLLCDIQIFEINEKQQALTSTCQQKNLSRIVGKFSKQKQHYGLAAVKNIASTILIENYLNEIVYSCIYLNMLCIYPQFLFQ